MIKLTLISLLAICHFTGGQYFIVRQNTGDVLKGPNKLDCSLHNAVRLDDTRCNCGPRSSYYTDKNNVTQCFKGSGSTELSCNIFEKGTVPKDITTIPFANSAKTMELDFSDYYCNLEFKSILYWVNDTWEKFPKEHHNFEPFERSEAPDQEGFVKVWKGILWKSFSEELKKIYAGHLIRFNYQVCKEISCVLFKFAGEEPWTPHTISTTTTTTTTAPPTTTTPTTTTPTTTASTTTPQTTTQQTTTKKSPVTKPVSGDDDDDDNLLVKILVPIAVIVFLIILAVVIFLYWRNKNSRVPKDNTVFVSGSVVPQPTAKKGHVDPDDDKTFIDISENPSST